MLQLCCDMQERIKRLERSVAQQAGSASISKPDLPIELPAASMQDFYQFNEWLADQNNLNIMVRAISNNLLMM